MTLIICKTLLQYLRVDLIIQNQDFFEIINKFGIINKLPL